MDFREREIKLMKYFSEAIEAEKASQSLYEKAIETCDDEEIKSILVEFMRDEIRHEKVIVEKYRILKEKYKE